MRSENRMSTFNPEAAASAYRKLVERLESVPAKDNGTLCFSRLNRSTNRKKVRMAGVFGK